MKGMIKMKNEKITERDVDFAKWYTDVVRAANLADYTSVKGCIAIEPNGYAIWEKMQEILDKKFKELGHVNCQMPLLIPESLFNKEKELIVLKNNQPSAIILSPEEYRRLTEIEEDYYLLIEAEKRLIDNGNKDTIPMDVIIKKRGIKKEELEGSEDVDIE